MKEKRKKYWKNTMSNINKLKVMTNYRFIWIEKSECLEGYISFIMKFKKYRYEVTGVKPLDLIPGYYEFIDSVVQSLFTNNMACIVGLESSDGKIIAAQFGIFYGRGIYWLYPAYNLDFSKYSPGRILIWETALFAFRNGYKFFDFTIGTDHYKLQWSNRIFEIYKIQASNDPDNECKCEIK